MKSSNPKKLSIREVCRVYYLLGQSKQKKFLIDEVVEIFNTVPPRNIQRVLGILYPKKSFTNPMDVGLSFTNGLKVNRFFDFQSFIGILTKHGRSE